MKNYSDITESLDITTKQYVDSGFMSKTGGTFTGDVTITPGHLKTDLIKSADDSKWIAEFTAAGLEIGGSGTPLRFYSSTRPFVVNQSKELAYTSDIPSIPTHLPQSTYTIKTGVLDKNQWVQNEYDIWRGEQLIEAGSEVTLTQVSGIYRRSDENTPIYISSYDSIANDSIDVTTNKFNYNYVEGEGFGAGKVYSYKIQSTTGNEKSIEWRITVWESDIITAYWYGDYVNNGYVEPYNATLKYITSKSFEPATYNLSDSTITDNSDVTMTVCDDIGIVPVSVSSGKLVIKRDRVPISNINYSYKVKLTNQKGQFVIVNDYVATDVVKISASWIAKDKLLGLCGFQDDGTGRIYAVNLHDLGFVERIKMNNSSIEPGNTGTVDLGTVITAHQDISGKANLSGGNTFSGLQTINAPTNVSGSEQTTMKVKTSNGGAIIFGKEGAYSGTMIRLDQTDGTCRLRFRSSSSAGAVVWEQPEQGAKFFVDLGKSGADYHRITFPASAGTLALTSQIPTSSTVSGWGFTKNTGTVTSVAVKMNGETKGTVTSSGTIDLGTVITAHQDISGKANLAGNNTFTGGQTITGSSGGYSVNASGYVKGSWLQSSVMNNKGSNTGKVCVFDDNGWIYYRTPSEILSEASGATLDELTAHINTVATQTTLGHIKMYVEGDTLYLNT